MVFRMFSVGVSTAFSIVSRVGQVDGGSKGNCRRAVSCSWSERGGYEVWRRDGVED